MSVILDGTRLRDIGIRVKLNSDYPATPPTRDHIVTIPNMHGAHDMGAFLDPLDFNLECDTLANSQLGIEKTVSKLKEILFDQYARPKTIKLIFEFEPEKWYNVRFRGQMPIVRDVVLGQFPLQLTAYTPFKYAPATYYDPDFIATYDTDTEYDDGVTEYKNQTHTPFKNARQYAGVFNYSHYATPFSFVIEGYVKNPKITNTTSGVSAQFNNVTVEADERLYFDSKLMTTWKVKADEDEWFWLTPYQMMRYPAEWDKLNRYNDMSGHFLELVSGDNTILFEGENPDAQVNFRWEHRFL